MSPQWFIYLIRTRSNSLYTGITTNVERRFDEHQAAGKKGAKSLKGKGPLTLVYQYKIADRSVASKLEAKIKKLDKAKKEALVSGNFAISTLICEIESELS